MWTFFDKIKIIYLEHLNEALIMWNEDKDRSIFIDSDKPSNKEIN